METDYEWADIFGQYTSRMRMLQEQGEDCLNILRYMQSQVDSQWQGQGAQAFENKLEELRRELQEIVQLQEQARRVLQSAAVSLDVY